MKKGDLNRRITIMRATTSDDGTATVSDGPTAIGKRWAKKTDVSDGEKIRAAQQGQQLTTRFTVLSDSLTRTITGKDIIMLDEVSYEVTGTKEVGEGRRDGIEITAASQPDATA